MDFIHILPYASDWGSASLWCFSSPEYVLPTAAKLREQRMDPTKRSETLLPGTRERKREERGKKEKKRMRLAPSQIFIIMCSIEVYNISSYCATLVAALCWLEIIHCTSSSLPDSWCLYTSKQQPEVRTVTITSCNYRMCVAMVILSAYKNSPTSEFSILVPNFATL